MAIKNILLIFFVILIIYVYFSFFKVDYKSKCFFYPNPQIGGAKDSLGWTVCGNHIYGKTYVSPNFPFLENSTEKTEFCKRNIKNVENACGFKIEELLFEDFYKWPFECLYLTKQEPHNNTYLIIKKYPVEYEFSKFEGGGIKRTVGGSEVRIEERYLTKGKCKDLTNIKID